MKVIVCIANNKGVSFNKRLVSRDEEVTKDIEANYSDGYTFIEHEIPDIAQVDEIILYKWNRDYPADSFFDFNKKEFSKISSTDMTGKSHEKITREIWVRK